jgi:hypothetical protein
MNDQSSNEPNTQLFGLAVRYDKFPFKLGALLYLISYSFYFLFLNSFFWDDWIINYRLSANEAAEYWKTQLGFFPTNRFVEINLLQRNPIAFHVLTLVIFFLIPVVFFRISRSISFISQKQKFYIALLLLVLPINSARVSMACFRLSYSLLLFLVAWLILVDSKTTKIKYLSIPLFLLSFLAQSLIPFFLLPCAHSAYLAFSEKRTWKHRSVLGSAGLIFLPLFYYVFVWKFDPPSPERTDYFTPSTSGSLRAVAIFLVVFIVFVVTRWKSETKQLGWRTQDKLALSAVMLSVGSFAYMASGRLLDVSEWMLSFVPSSSGWESRHQLLLGLGFALAIAVVIDSIKIDIQKSVFVILITACVVLNVSTTSGYYLDSLKQKEFIAAVSEIDGLVKDGSVVVIDHTDWLNARGRSIRPYEWKAMLHKATDGIDIEVVDVPEICSEPDKIVNQTVLVIDAPSGRLRALLNRKVNLSILRLDAYLCY